MITKEIYKTISIFLVILFLMSCKNRQDISNTQENLKEERLPNNEIKNKTEETQDDHFFTINLPPGFDYPDWIINPPANKTSLYSIGYSQETNPGIAITSASSFAKEELSKLVRTKIESVTKQFLTESIIKDDSKINQFSKTISQTIANDLKPIIKIMKQQLNPSNNQYHYYVLVKLDLINLTTIINRTFSQNIDSFKKLNTEKSFYELTKLLQNLDSNSFPELHVQLLK
jgi:hypothetical protein